jgi:hypothetical protein
MVILILYEQWLGVALRCVCPCCSVRQVQAAGRLGAVGTATLLYDCGGTREGGANAGG